MPNTVLCTSWALNKQLIFWGACPLCHLVSDWFWDPSEARLREAGGWRGETIRKLVDSGLCSHPGTSLGSLKQTWSCRCLLGSCLGGDLGPGWHPRKLWGSEHTFKSTPLQTGILPDPFRTKPIPTKRYQKGKLAVLGDGLLTFGWQVRATFVPSKGGY